jgi:hypothetical protein
MNFYKYSYEEESRLVRLKNKIWTRARNLLTAREHTIKLSDPQKRLEDSFKEMSRSTGEQITSIKFGFSNQITDVESKLFNSQRRLQDSIIELSSKSGEQFGCIRDSTRSLLIELKQSMNDGQRALDAKLGELYTRTNSELNYTNKYLNGQLGDVEAKILSLTGRLHSTMVDISKKTLFQYESMQELSMNQTKSIKALVMSTQELVEDSLNKLGHASKDELAVAVHGFNERFDALDKRLTEWHVKLTLAVEKSAAEAGIKQKSSEDSVAAKLAALRETLNSIDKQHEAEFKSIRAVTNYMSNQLNALQTQLSQVVESCTKLSETLETKMMPR